MFLVLHILMRSDGMYCRKLENAVEKLKRATGMLVRSRSLLCSGHGKVYFSASGNTCDRTKQERSTAQQSMSTRLKTAGHRVYLKITCTQLSAKSNDK